MTRKEKLLGMIDTRMEELIEIESYELCAKLRDWRKEVVLSEDLKEEYIPNEGKDVYIKLKSQRS